MVKHTQCVWRFCGIGALRINATWCKSPSFFSFPAVKGIPWVLCIVVIGLTKLLSSRSVNFLGRPGLSLGLSKTTSSESTGVGSFACLLMLRRANLGYSLAIPYITSGTIPVVFYSTFSYYSFSLCFIFCFIL